MLGNSILGLALKTIVSLPSYFTTVNVDVAFVTFKSTPCNFCCLSIRGF